VLRVAAPLAAVLVLPAAAATAGQLSASSEVQGAFYPRTPAERAAIGDEIRGWAAIAFDRALSGDLEIGADLRWYGSSRRRDVVDGEATVVWRGSRGALAGGLLRERWGRFTDSALDPLGAANTPFSLVHPELRLSQPTIKATAFFDRLSLDLYAVRSARRQPVPAADGRFGFGVVTHNVEQPGRLGDHGLGARVSGTELGLDWAAHVFTGLSPRPTFVPRLTPAGRLDAVDAVYVDILQFSGELETTRGDWRFLAEGFGRRGAIDVTGRERNHAHLAAAAEYQRLGAFDGAYNLIPRFEVMADTRGDRTDVPFASAARAAMRIAATGILPVEVDMAYSYDWVFRGHGIFAAVEKALAESPTLNVGLRFTGFSSGQTRSVLDIWKDDFELLAYVRLELSR
jgi:hypothetical protein